MVKSNYYINQRVCSFPSFFLVAYPDKLKTIPKCGWIHEFLCERWMYAIEIPHSLNKSKWAQFLGNKHIRTLNCRLSNFPLLKWHYRIAIVLIVSSIISKLDFKLRIFFGIFFVSVDLVFVILLCFSDSIALVSKVDQIK